MAIFTLRTALAVLAALVFARAAMLKFRSRATFGGVVDNYDLLPHVLVAPVAFALPIAEGMIAAAFVSPGGQLAGWCANSVISPENLCFIAETCRSVLSANRAEQRDAHTGIVAFREKTLVFREGEPGIFLAYLDSPVNDEVLAWLFSQVTPLLAEEGVKLE